MQQEMCWDFIGSPKRFPNMLGLPFWGSATVPSPTRPIGAAVNSPNCQSSCWGAPSCCHATGNVLGLHWEPQKVPQHAGPAIFGLCSSPKSHQTNWGCCEQSQLPPNLPTQLLGGPKLLPCNRKCVGTSLGAPKGSPTCWASHFGALQQSQVPPDQLGLL